MSKILQHWDIFCRVVDNYGDAAVCWRLARQLAIEHGLKVRLWVDEQSVLPQLDPRVSNQTSMQSVDGVDIRPWQALDAEPPHPGDVAIEAFGCGLPERYTQAMAQRTPSTLWITLEYLSAESWVGGHHGLPSPHPRLPVQRHFFFPGFDAGTGGLLREQGLLEQRDAFQADSSARATLWKDLGFPPPSADALTVSLFAYENPAVFELLGVWAAGKQPVVAAIPDSRLRPEVAAFFGASMVADGTSLSRGQLEARFIPFLSQPRYEQLLWSCDWNFVRGEDSFVRAQWAARPLVWHIYPQQEGAHRAKLNAFLDRYLVGLHPETAAAMRTLWATWNGDAHELSASWEALVRNRKFLEDHSLAWASRLASMGDLAGNLVHFCISKVQ